MQNQLFLEEVVLVVVYRQDIWLNKHCCILSIWGFYEERFSRLLLHYNFRTNLYSFLVYGASFSICDVKS